MSTEDIRTTVGGILDLKKQGGAVGVLSAFVATIILLLQLPDASIQKLREVWWLLSLPSGLVFLSWMFTSYLSEHKARTQAEQGIQVALTTLVGNFERLFSNHLDDKMYLERRFDGIDDRLRSIYGAMEKREGYRPGADTEKFLSAG